MHKQHIHTLSVSHTLLHTLSLPHIHTHTYTRTHARTLSLSRKHTHIHLYTHKNAYTHTCTHAHAHPHTLTLTRMRARAHILIQKHKRIRVYLCVYVFSSVRISRRLVALCLSLFVCRCVRWWGVSVWPCTNKKETRLHLAVDCNHHNDHSSQHSFAKTTLCSTRLQSSSFSANFAQNEDKLRGEYGGT